jgi:SAM-dependent methyltransferase
MSENSHSVVLEKKNENFWEEPCGTCSLKKRKFKNLTEFDQWYLNFYPYLLKYLPIQSLKGKKVLEVGLGMGTVSEKLAENSMEYFGMDLASSAVDLVEKRISQKKLNGQVVKGNVLTYPLPKNFYDYVFSIGCLHHTGDLALSIKQLIDALKPGGKGTIMIYNAFSYRHWLSAPFATLKRLCFAKPVYQSQNASRKQRLLYDPNSNNESAPFTEFLTRQQTETLFQKFDIKPVINLENIGSFFMFPIPRKIKLKLFGPWLGLDLYVQFQKPITSES